MADIEKYTHGHIYETDPPIFIKFIAKCWSLQPLSFEIKNNCCEHVLLSLALNFSDGTSSVVS